MKTKFDFLIDKTSRAYKSYFSSIEDIDHSVSSLVNSFNRKKKSDEISKTSMRKTGKIDMTRISHYKTSDDIFSQIEMSPTGKSHHITILLDWSISMGGVILPILKQAMIIALFCKKVNIDYKIVSFTAKLRNDISSGGDDGDSEYSELAFHEKNALITSSASMNTIFESGMSRTDIIGMGMFMYAISKLPYLYNMFMPTYLKFEHDKLTGLPYYENKEFYNLVKRYLMGGTPLIEALTIIGNDIKHNVIGKYDHVNLIAITDGMGEGSINVPGQFRSSEISHHNIKCLYDKNSNKKVNIKENDTDGVRNKLMHSVLKWIGYQGVNVSNIFISTGSPEQAICNYSHELRYRKAIIQKTKHVSYIDDFAGFDRMLFINKNAFVDTFGYSAPIKGGIDNIDVNKSTPHKIAKAFANTIATKKSSRIIGEIIAENITKRLYF